MLLPVLLRKALARGGPEFLLSLVCGAVGVEGLSQQFLTLSIVCSVGDLFSWKFRYREFYKW